MNVLLWAGVMLIGGAGSVARFLADGLVAAAADRRFPLGTLAVNVSGAVILGVITGLALGHDQALLAGTADQRDAHPEQHVHGRTRTRLTTAVASWIAAYPAAMLAAA